RETARPANEATAGRGASGPRGGVEGGAWWWHPHAVQGNPSVWGTSLLPYRQKKKQRGGRRMDFQCVPRCLPLTRPSLSEGEEDGLEVRPTPPRVRTAPFLPAAPRATAVRKIRPGKINWRRKFHRL